MVSPLTLRLEAFSKLSQDDRSSVEGLLRKAARSVGARRDLMREGDKPRSTCLMLEGWACRYKTLPDGRRQIVAFLVPGDLCDLNIYLLKEMDHNIGAITAIEVAEIARDDFEALTADHPRIIETLWRETLVAMAIQREWTLSLGQRTAYERIAHLMLEMFLRLERVGLANRDGFDWPLTQVDIADATGLTAVHVNRTLQELRKARLIELHNRRLTIPDMHALKNAALFNANYLHLQQGDARSDADD